MSKVSQERPSKISKDHSCQEITRLAKNYIIFLRKIIPKFLANRILSLCCKQLRPRGNVGIFGITGRDRVRQWGSIFNWQTGFTAAGSPAPGHPGKVSWPHWDVDVTLSWGGQFLLPTVSWKLLNFFCFQQDLTSQEGFHPRLFLSLLFSSQLALILPSRFQAVASQKADITVLSLRIEGPLLLIISLCTSTC